MIRSFFIIVLIALSSFLVPRFSHAAENLTWTACLVEAAKNNPDLISSAEAVEQKKAAASITKSGLYPQISASLSAGAAKSGAVDKSSKNYAYGVSADQLLFNGFQTINNVNAAKENLKAAQEAFLFTSSETRFTLRSAFVELLRAQELIRVAQEIRKIRKDNFDLISMRYLSGLEHKGALMKAQSDLAEAHYELSKAERDLELAQRALSKAMGRNEFIALSAQGNFTVTETTNEKQDLKPLIEHHPTVLQAVSRRNSAMFGIKSSRGSFFPTVSISGGRNQSSQTWPPQNDSWNGGVNVTLPLLEGGLRTAQLQQAQAVYAQSAADEISARHEVEVNLHTMWSALQDAIETVEVQRLQLAAAEERSKISESQYSTGFIQFDNWIVIQDDLVNSKKSYLDAQAGALIAEAKWIEAKGETLEYVR
jgi:outer membrane protein TolC